MFELSAILIVIFALGGLALIQNHQIERLMAKLNELAGILTKSVDQLEKALQELRTALGNVQLPPEAEAALTKLDAVAKALDDLNPDEDLPAGNG